MLHQILYLSIQAIRRAVQLSVVLGLLALIFINLYAHYRAARALEDVEGYKVHVFDRIDKHLENQEDPQEFLDDYSGTIWSMKISGIDFTDPLAAVESIAASKQIFIPLLISIAIPVGLTILFGKIFCSWICPAYLIMEISNKLRKLLKFAEISPGEVKFSYNNKYLVLLVGIIYALLLSIPLFPLIYPPAIVSRLFHGLIFGTAVTGMSIMLGLIILFEIFVSPRWWCRTMCPGGALYGILGWKRLVKIKCNTETCNGCGKCQPVCQMGLNPVTDVGGIECDNCGGCLRHCKPKSLSYSLRLPNLKRKNQAAQPPAAISNTEISPNDEN